jgi:hypothetical protein
LQNVPYHSFSRRARFGALLSITLVPLLLVLIHGTPAQAVGTVTDCSNETDFDAKLAGGGLVNFNCSGTPPFVITVPASPAVVATAAPALRPTDPPIPGIWQFVSQVSAGPHDTVKAADGLAELLIPNGALPAGKTVGDISLKPVPAAQAPVAFDVQLKGSRHA